MPGARAGGRAGGARPRAPPLEQAPRRSAPLLTRVPPRRRLGAPVPPPPPAEEIRQPAQPLALRLSGQLLLGITRIYLKKVTLLYEDGQLALKKLAEFFKPGAVDLDEGGAAGAPGAGVTLAAGAAAADDDFADDAPDPGETFGCVSSIARGA